MSTLDKTIPASLEAEEAALGSLLIDPDAIIKVASFLRAEDFYSEKNGWIYQAILDLHERRAPADFVTVCEELANRSQLHEVGGDAYVTDLINAVPTAIHIEHYAHIIERKSTLRRLITAAGQIAQLAYDEARDVDEVVDEAEQVVFGVSERRVRRDLVPIHHIMGEVVDRIDYLARHRGEVLGVPTGFRLLDKVLGGLQKSDLIILAARPSAGKTSLALNLAANAVKKYHQRVAFFSLEMSNEQLVQRMLASETGIDQQRLRLGDIHDDEWPVLMEAAGVLANTPLFIDDTPAVSALEMRTKARRLHAEHGLDLVVVDYLQLMRGTGNRNENRVQEISYISRALKELARELKVPVVALSQLSRAVEQRADHRPVLSDLRESGCLAGDSLVYLPDAGRYVPIGDLTGSAGFRVLGLNTATWKLEPSLVTNSFCTGRKPIYRMVTRLGRTVRATANHRFLTIGGWKRLDELEAGDHIALPRRLVGPDRQTNTALFTQNVSRERAARVARVVQSDILSQLAQSDVYWDQLVAVQPDGVEEVFDLTVAGLHNFVADNIIVHNSIEQDADIVMFVHREDMYDANTERKNIADIMVAKHRNGPTGTVSLYFRKELTLFTDLEVVREHLEPE